MVSHKQIRIKETVAALRKLQQGNIPMISNRIRAIIEIKKHEKTGISKREVAGIIGVNHNSVQTWRKMYEQGGLKPCCIIENNPDALRQSRLRNMHKWSRNSKIRTMAYAAMQSC